MRRGPEMPMLMRRIGRSIARSKAFARAAEAGLAEGRTGWTFRNVAVDDYSLEAERQIRKIIAGGVINLR
jgi:hypothetical protein